MMRLDCAWYGRQYDLALIARTIMRLYHNPRCSKSRQAVSLLTDRGIEFEEYIAFSNSGIHTDDLELLSNLDGIIRFG